MDLRGISGVAMAIAPFKVQEELSCSFVASQPDDVAIPPRWHTSQEAPNAL